MCLERQKRQLQPAVARLLDAHEYARDAAKESWDFAVEIAELGKHGLDRSDLRWLGAKGFLEHAIETTSPSDGQRSFRNKGRALFLKRTCFVLTECGVVFARKMCEETETDRRLTGAWRESEDQVLLAAPRWDGERQELRMGKSLVKQFKRPSPNQEAVLMAFEEEGWPARVDDPLPPEQEIDSKRRLNDTIKALNRNQKSALLRFIGDGTGEGIIWKLVESDL